MGNVSGREDAGGGSGGCGGGRRVDREEPQGISIVGAVLREGHARAPSSDLMVNSPPRSPGHPPPPHLFAPQVPVVPLQNDVPVFLNQMKGVETEETFNQPHEKGIPTLITWSYGGNDVAVEGSWDSWKSRKVLQRSGKDHIIVLVLPSGVYHYKFIVDGNLRYIPDLPYEADEMGNVVNLLDVHDYVPENFETVREFEAPPSPDSGYNQAFPTDEDFAKEPLLVPPQLHLTVLGTENSDEATSSTKPQHAVLDHLFIEKGWVPQSVLALGMSHRFQTKYVTVVLYKPLDR